MSRRSANHPAAQSRALTRLTHEFRERFLELYAEEKANPRHSRIQSQAKTRLSLEFPQRYRELYLQEVGLLKLEPVSSERMWLFPMDSKPDVVFADGGHRYWSTHCRHDDCDACSATELAPGVPRRPAQCKTCSAPCLCHCHKADAPEVTR